MQMGAGNHIPRAFLFSSGRLDTFHQFAELSHGTRQSQVTHQVANNQTMLAEPLQVDALRGSASNFRYPGNSQVQQSFRDQTWCAVLTVAPQVTSPAL